MVNEVIIVIIASVVYFLAMLLVGMYSTRVAVRTEEDYFLASRGLGGYIFFSAIVGTTLTALALNGFSGQAYHSGYGVLGITIGGLAISIPFLINTVGYRLWIISKVRKYITPVQALRDRFESDALSWLLIIIYFIYTIPYIASGAIGAGLSFEAYTNGVVPYWLGGLIAVAIVGIYVFMGGMRATAWTNAVQFLIFTSFIILVLVMVPKVAGNAPSLYGMIEQIKPELLKREGHDVLHPKLWFAQFVLFGGAVFGTTPILVRFMAAKSQESFRFLSTWYPLGLLLVMGSSVIIGVWAAILVPGLEGAQSDQALPLLIAEYLPAWFLAFAVTALFATIMSTMDGQILALGSLITVDIINRYRKKTDEKQKVLIGRISSILILLISYLLALMPNSGLYSLLTFAFAGSWITLPVLIASLYWRRFNRYGALTGLIVGTVLVPSFQFNLLPHFGFGPLIPTLLIQFPMMVGITLLTPAQAELANKFFTVFDRVWVPRRNTFLASRNLVQTQPTPPAHHNQGDAHGG